MADSTRLKLVISSEVRLIDLVHTASESLAQAAGFDEDEALNVGLAVREAVINAIVHGNREDRSRDVYVDLVVDDATLKAVVRDQGQGFDVEATPDPTEGDALMATSGRGLLMMQAFVDVVEQRPYDGGFEVVLIKNLQSTADSPD